MTPSPKADRWSPVDPIPTIDLYWQFGGPGRGRTADTAIFSRVLYQLSYRATGEQEDYPRLGSRRDGCLVNMHARLRFTADGLRDLWAPDRGAVPEASYLGSRALCAPRFIIFEPEPWKAWIPPAGRRDAV